MTKDTVYKVTVAGPGVSIEGDVEKSVGDQIVYMVLTGMHFSVQKQSPRPLVNATAGSKAEQVKLGVESNAPMALREFLNQCGANRVMDKIAAIGLYKKDYEDSDKFDRDSLIKAFESAAEPVPKNLSRDLRSASKAGWIAEKSGTKGTYYVTGTGEDVVNEQFPKDAVKKAKSSATSSRIRKKTGGENESIN